MKKYDEDGKGCATCIGFGFNICHTWIGEIGRAHVECGHKRCSYANKLQTEALLQWHNEKYGTIQQIPKEPLLIDMCPDCIYGPEYSRNCENWLAEVGHPNPADMCQGHYFVGRDTLERIVDQLAEWDVKNGSRAEWEKNNVPMKNGMVGVP